MENKKGSILVKVIGLTAFILLAIMALLVIFTSFEVSGYRIFAVKSGSMEPAFSQGSVVIDRAQDKYDVGDIITFKISNGTDTVTHRIVEVSAINDTVLYTVKGDANQSADSERVIQENVVGKVLYSIPYLGIAVSFLRTPAGLVIFILIPALMIIYGEIGKIKKEIDRIKGSKGEKKEESDN